MLTGLLIRFAGAIRALARVKGGGFPSREICLRQLGCRGAEGEGEGN